MPKSSVTVEQAVEADIHAFGNLPVGSGAITATARALARMIDDGDNSATSRSMCAARLVEAMTALRDLAASTPEADRLDDLASRRARRLATG